MRDAQAEAEAAAASTAPATVTDGGFDRPVRRRSAPPPAGLVALLAAGALMRRPGAAAPTAGERVTHRARDRNQLASRAPPGQTRPPERKLQSQGVHRIAIVGSNRRTTIDFGEGVLGMPFVFEQPNLDTSRRGHLYFNRVTAG